MGLDMYLYLRKSNHDYYFKDYQDKDSSIKGLYPSELKDFEQDIFDRNLVSITHSTTCQIGYWRKANAIHNWFVENCADGEDDCREIFVDKEELKKLLTACTLVLDNHANASKYLPTTSGFFFGSTDYDDWYYQDLKYTKELLEKVIYFLDKNDTKDCKDYYDVVYQASW